MSWFGVKKCLNFRFWPKNQIQFRWRPVLFLFFRRPPDFGLKNCLNFRFWPKTQTQFRWRPFFFFWRPPVFERKKRLNFRTFREIPSQFSDKPCETDSRTMKNRVEVVCTFRTLSKKPPLFPNPGYAPVQDYKALLLCASNWEIFSAVVQLEKSLLFRFAILGCCKSKKKAFT